MLLATLVALAGALTGLWLTGTRGRARVMVPLSAGVLLGVVLFGLIPEILTEIGPLTGTGLMAAGYLLLFAISRYAYPVCPTCTHDHDHHACDTELHGFAIPLLAATAVHAFLDGWSVTTVQSAPLGIRMAVPIAIAIHKFPEGIALGGMLRAALRSRRHAFAWCVLAESATLAGGGLGLVIAPHLGTAWTSYPIAIAGGCFLYLGIHAVHEEWKRRGAGAAFAPAGIGAVGAAAIQRGVHILFP